jgi:hypothetical protein
MKTRVKRRKQHKDLGAREKSSEETGETEESSGGPRSYLQAYWLSFHSSFFKRQAAMFRKAFTTASVACCDEDKLAA